MIGSGWRSKGGVAGADYGSSAAWGPADRRRLMAGRGLWVRRVGSGAEGVEWRGLVASDGRREGRGLPAAEGGAQAT